MSNDLAPDEQYEYLEWRPSRWRKQLSLKGRKMTVGQFVSTMLSADWDVAEAARQFGLPVGAAVEAVAYYERHKDLIIEEAEAEKRWLIERGYLREPAALSR